VAIINLNTYLTYKLIHDYSYKAHNVWKMPITTTKFHPLECLIYTMSNVYGILVSVDDLEYILYLRNINFLNFQTSSNHHYLHTSVPANRKTLIWIKFRMRLLKQEVLME